MKEIVDDPLIQPKQLKMHCRFLTKVYKDKETTDEYEPLASSDKGAKTSNEADYNRETSAGEVSREMNKRIKKKDILKPQAKSSHRMNLRNRK